MPYRASEKHHAWPKPTRLVLTATGRLVPEIARVVHRPSGVDVVPRECLLLNPAVSGQVQALNAACAISAGARQSSRECGRRSGSIGPGQRNTPWLEYAGLTSKRDGAVLHRNRCKTALTQHGACIMSLTAKALRLSDLECNRATVL